MNPYITPEEAIKLSIWTAVADIQNAKAIFKPIHHISFEVSRIHALIRKERNSHFLGFFA